MLMASSHAYSNNHNPRLHVRESTLSEAAGSLDEQDSRNGESARKTAYERMSEDLNNDSRVLKEITLGKRIGFYRMRGELGSGNFSQVKLGIHALTKGKSRFQMFFCFLIIVIAAY